MLTLSTALKEWDIQISSLLSGQQAFLLRKGGILESNNEFEVEHPRFLWFPTFIHQDPRMVKESFRNGIKTYREEPTKIDIRGHGEAVKIFEVPSRQKLERLSDLYIWDAPLLDMRFAYRPEKPLYLVLVKAFQLSSPVTIANTLDYAGCKSWVPLAESIDISHAHAVLTDDQVASRLDRIRAAFA
jgi:hypothetical protein